jgi:hypothetical protein
MRPENGQGSKVKLMLRYLLCASVQLDNGPFEAIADERAKRILNSRAAREEISIVIYNVGTGRRKTTEVRLANGKPVTTTKEDQPFDPVTNKSYEFVTVTSNGHDEVQKRFRANQAKVMSITDLYKEILSIGRDQPGSLAEVSIFSHAINKGPILVNSYDGYAERAERNPEFPLRERRDPNDKDGRMKDFNDSNMPPADRALFKSAFRPTGYVWNWGCNDILILHNLLRKIDMSGGGAPTSDVIKLRQLTKEQIEFLSLAASILNIDTLAVRKTQRCEFNGNDFRRLLEIFLGDCYAYQLATQTKVRTFAALPGTSADWPDKRNMSINVNQRPNANIYKRWLGIKLDPEDRGYGEFTSDLLKIK